MHRPKRSRLLHLSRLPALALAGVLAGVLAVPLLPWLGAGRARAAPAERRATIFYTGAVQGALEPCGCTSDPLGDIARMTGLVRRAGKPGTVLVLDAGNLSYPLGGLSAKRREGA